MNENILVSDYMDHQPAVIHCDTPLTEVVKILIKKGITGAPVVNASKQVLGFVSEKDCIHSLLNSGYYAEDAMTVNDVMRKDTLTVHPNDSIIDLARAMEDNRPKVYPVVEEGRLVGVVTRAHALKALQEQHLNKRQRGSAA